MRREKGYVWIVALFVILVTMTAAFLVAARLQRENRLFLHERRSAELTAMTDAALAQALSRLWGDPDYEGGTEAFADGEIVIETRKISGLVIEVTVKALYGGGRRAARARVRIDRDPPERRDPPRVLLWEPIPFR